MYMIKYRRKDEVEIVVFPDGSTLLAKKEGVSLSHQKAELVIPWDDITHLAVPSKLVRPLKKYLEEHGIDPKKVIQI